MTICVARMEVSGRYEYDLEIKDRMTCTIHLCGEYGIKEAVRELRRAADELAGARVEFGDEPEAPKGKEIS